MATMPDTETFVTVGVDTPKDTHLAVALDQLGRWLDAIEIPTTSAGYAELLGWATDLGTIDTVGIEGTGGNVEKIRILRLIRRSAVVAQGQASNQIHALIATAPDELRDQLRDLTTRKRVAVAARWRPDRQADSVTTTAKLALKSSLAGSWTWTLRSKSSAARRSPCLIHG